MRYTKNDIIRRVEWLNELTGENYIATHNHYGWEMHIEREGGGQSRGYFGFDCRKTVGEFAQYLYGCCTGIGYARQQHE